MGDIRSRDAPSGAGGSTDTRRTSSEASAFRFAGGGRDDSIPDLIRRLTEQGSHLAEQQMRLVQAEIRAGMNDLKASAGAMAGAAVLGLAGLGVTLMGIAYLLAEVMPLWGATLIVGVATLAIAYLMFAAGQKKLQSTSLEMERTRHTIERAPSAMSGNEERTNGR